MRRLLEYWLGPLRPGILGAVGPCCGCAWPRPGEASIGRGPVPFREPAEGVVADVLGGSGISAKMRRGSLRCKETLCLPCGGFLPAPKGESFVLVSPCGAARHSPSCRSRRVSAGPCGKRSETGNKASLRGVLPPVVYRCPAQRAPPLRHRVSPQRHPPALQPRSPRSYTPASVGPLFPNCPNS